MTDAPVGQQVFESAREAYKDTIFKNCPVCDDEIASTFTFDSLVDHLIQDHSITDIIVGFVDRWRNGQSLGILHDE